MGQHVDEARRHGLAVHVEHGAGLQFLGRAHIGDAVAIDRHIAREGLAAGAVIDHPAAQQQIVRRIRTCQIHAQHEGRREQQRASPVSSNVHSLPL